MNVKNGVLTLTNKLDGRTLKASFRNIRTKACIRYMENWDVFADILYNTVTHKS